MKRGIYTETTRTPLSVPHPFTKTKGSNEQQGMNKGQ